MYTPDPSYSVRRKLDRHASTILIGGIFLFFSLSFFMAICKMPCETISAEHHLLKKASEYHEGHKLNFGLNNNINSSKLSTSVYLVIIILSGPSYKEQRDVIRETWLSVKHTNVTHYFIIGTYGLPAADVQKLKGEEMENQDLVLLPHFKDSYQQLTKKLLESFIWLQNNVAFQYVFKGDDDTFVRLNELIKELHSKPLERLYWGFFDGRANVKRTGQWAERNWVLCDKYGPHARGGGYILSQDLVSYIVTNAAMLQKFNSEDISVGAWLGPLNIHRYHDPRFDTEFMSRGCNNQFIVTHKQSPKDMVDKWYNLNHNGVLCSKEFKVKMSYNYNWKVLPSQCCVRNDSDIP